MTESDDLAVLTEAAHALSRTLRRSGERHVGLDALPGSEFDVLQFVVAHPGSTVSAVARALRLQSSNVSTTVRGLVGRGLVERVPDPRDQRRTLLRASDLAREHRRVLGESWARTLGAGLAALGPEDAAAVRAAVPALARLADVLVLGEAPAPGPCPPDADGAGDTPVGVPGPTPGPLPLGRPYPS